MRIGKKVIAWILTFVMVVTMAPVTFEKNEAYAADSGSGTIYYNFREITNPNYFTTNSTYMFIYGRKYSSTEAVVSLPTGSARLKILSDNTTTYGDAGWDSSSVPSSCQKYATPVQSGKDFDTCPWGGINYVNNYTTTTKNPNVKYDACWIYRCNSTGVKENGPFYAYTYETKDFNSSNVTIELKKTYTAETKNVTVNKSDITVKVTVDSDEFSIPEYTITDSTINYPNDRTFTVQLGNVTKDYVIPQEDFQEVQPSGLFIDETNNILIGLQNGQQYIIKYSETATNEEGTESTVEKQYEVTADENGTILADKYSGKEIKVIKKGVPISEDSSTITINSDPAIVNVPVLVTDTKLDRYSVYFASLNVSTTLQASVLPENVILKEEVKNRNFTWKSENEKIATVDEDGKITSVSQGTTKIIVTSKQGTKVAECRVDVYLPIIIPKVDVPVTGNDNSIKITAEVDDNEVKVDKINIEDLNKVADKKPSSDDPAASESPSPSSSPKPSSTPAPEEPKQEKTLVNIDVSGLNKKIDTIVIPTDTFKEISKVASDETKAAEGLSITLSTVTVEVDDVALETISQAAEGNNIKLVVDDVIIPKLNETQNEVLKDKEVAGGVEAYFVSNGKRISDFKGGKITVKIPYVVPTDKDDRKYAVWYISDDGEIEKFKTSYVDEHLVFETGHFSDYVIVYDGEDEPEVTPTPEPTPEPTKKPVVTPKPSTYRQVFIAKVNKSTKNSNTITWNKYKDADGYVVYGAPCNTKDKKYDMKVLKTIKSGSTVKYVKNGLKKDTWYKYRVDAYKLVNGKKKVIASSTIIHAVAADASSKYINPSSVKVNKTKVTINKGKKFTIKAKNIITDKKKTKAHASMKFKTNDPGIVTVNSKGVITAKKKGTCTVFVIAQNGVYTRIEVTVK